MGLGRAWKDWVWASDIYTLIYRESPRRPQCPYDELEQSRRFPHTPMSLPARLLLCEGYRRADSIWYMYSDNPQYDRHEDAHQTAQAMACCEFD